MGVNDSVIKEFVEAIKQEPNERTTTINAIVARTDEEGVVWVYLAGSKKETPTASTSTEVAAGDAVTVEWRNNKLYIVGNSTNPAAGLMRVHATESMADVAYRAAESAVADAERAFLAANRAEDEAERATGYANDALTQLSVVEEVVDTLNWISEHGTYKKSEDTQVIERKMYFTLTGTVVVPETYDDDTKKITNLESYYELINNVYVKTSDTTYNPSKTYYTVSAEIVANPEGDPSENNYYEIFSIDKAVQNYISSHLALTDSGLWVVKDNQGYKVLLANDGLKVYDNGGHLVSTFGENIIFDAERPQRIGGDNAFIRYYDSNGDGKADKLEVVADSITFRDKGLYDDLEIGGRNLLKDTANLIKNWVLDQATVSDGICTITVASNSDRRMYQMPANSYFTPEPNTTYTLSVEAKSPNGANLQLSPYWSHTGNKTFNVTTEWKRYSYTFTSLADVSTSSTTIGTGSTTTGAVLMLRKPKLEIGNKATDWTPAPEDVDDALSGKKSTHTLSTNYSWTYANVITNSSENHDKSDNDGWTVSSTAGVSVGDTVRLKVTVSDMSNTPVYIIGTVTEIVSGTILRMKSHGVDTTVIDGGKILTNSIGANQIMANSITAQKLAIKDWTNYVLLNEYNHDSYGFSKIDDPSNPTTPWYRMKILARDRYVSDWFDCNGGESFRVAMAISSDVRGSKTRGGTTVEYLNVGMLILYQSADGTDGWSIWNPVTSSSAATEEYKETVLKIADNAVRFRVGVHIDGFNNAVGFSGTIKVRKFTVFKMANAELIVDGSITADKIDTGAITIGKLAPSEQALLGKTITTATDLDTLKTTGTYYLKVSNNPNAPTTGHGELEVNYSVGTPYQIWYPDNQSYYYKRTWNNTNSAWNSWIKIDAIDAAKTSTNYISADSSGIRIASANPATQAQRMVLTNNNLVMYDSLNVDRLTLNSTYGLLLGRSSGTRGGYAKVNDNGLYIYDIEKKCRAQVTASGLDVFDADGTTSVASFGATVRVGKTSDSIRISPNEISGYLDNLKCFSISEGGSAYNGITIQNEVYGKSKLHLIDSYARLEGRDRQNKFTKLSVGATPHILRLQSDDEVDWLTVEEVPKWGTYSGRVGLIKAPYRELQILWSGASYMGLDQEIDLGSKLVSDQLNGIVLAWSAYSGGAAQNHTWHYVFVPKSHIYDREGQGVSSGVMSNADFSKVGSKYVYVHNSRIVGNAQNTATGTASGITFANNYWVLRYVYGV